MSADQETVTADQPTTFPSSRAAALRAWDEFLPRVPAYDAERNGVRPGHRAVSRLSPAIRQRLVTEYELIAATLAAHPFARVEKFVQEILWRRYWKSWLELRPSVWTDYRADAARLRGDLRGYQAKRITELEEGRSGVEIMDHFADELRATGYLHNHARMWFAGFWIHTEKLPWELGADFFYRHLLDADPASNTLSWRWVAGIQTVGKSYLTRRSNLERYVAPELLAAHGGGLERLEDKLAQPARVDAPAFLRPETPEDADDTTLPEGLSPKVGLWVHGDDLCVETASSLAGLRPAGVFAGLDAGLFDGEEISPARRAYLGATLRDGLRRAGEHFGAEATFEVAATLADGLTTWARARGLAAVVAMRPAVGPLWEQLPELRTRLGREGITLHLVWRPEDVQTLPHARSGYFNFWQGTRADLLGHAGAAEARDPADGVSRGKHRSTRRRR